MEINGAKALYDHKYYPNTIVKLHAILDKNIAPEDQVTVYYYLGKSFENIDETGRAVNAYKSSLEFLNNVEVDADMILIQNACDKAVKKLQKK